MFSMYLHGPLQLLILDGVIQCLKKEHGISCVSHQSRVCLWRYLLLHTLSVFLEILSLLGCPGEAFPSEQDGCCPAGPLFFFCVPSWVLDWTQQQQRPLAASPAQEPEYDIFDSFWVLYLVLSESWPP